MKKSTLKFVASREKFESTILNPADRIICLSIAEVEELAKTKPMFGSFVKWNMIYHGFYTCVQISNMKLKNNVLVSKTEVKECYICTDSPEFLKSRRPL